jgi:hypothetical protein
MSNNLLLRDLNLRWPGCFYKDSYDGAIYRINSFYDDADTVFIRRSPVLEGAIEEEEIVEYTGDFDFKIPKLGYINCGDTLLFVIRNGVRYADDKFIRGLKPSTLLVEPSVGRDAKPIKSSKTMLSVLDSIDSTIDEAIADLYSGKCSGRALSKNIAIKVNFSLERIVLYSREVQIGVWVTPRKHFRLFTNAFNMELLSLNIPIKPFLGKESYEEAMESVSASLDDAINVEVRGLELPDEVCSQQSLFLAC